MDTDSQPEEEEPDYEPTRMGTDTQPEEDSLERFIEQDALLHLWQQPPDVLLPPHQGD